MAKKDYNLPISSYEEYMKNIDYMTYGIITYYSNKTYNDEPVSVEELYRWTYENKLKENQDEIEKLSKNKFNTVLRNIRKLAKMDNDLIIAKNSPNGIVYDINYYSLPHGYFVTIHHEVLKFLLEIGNSNIIKTYIFLKYRCSKGETKVTRQEIAEAIGLSPNSCDSLQRITDYTFLLNKIELINKKYKYEQGVIEDKVKFTTRQYCYFNLVDELKWVEDISRIRRIDR